METINKEKLSEVLKDKTGLSMLVCNSLVTNIFDNIVHILSTDNSLKIKNFGSFAVSQKNTRPGMNLHTKEKVSIPARKVIKFVPSRGLKARLNNEDTKIL